MGVMGIKGGTKTFSEGPRETVDRSNAAQMSPVEKAALGDRDLGQVLNELSDPNWVDPSKKVRAVGNDKLDKDAFMKLMLAQMKNQDPTNPLKSHEMAAQLAQFSSVEQMQNINTTLNDMKNSQKPATQFQALNFIGKAVSGDSSKLIRTEGDVDHDFRFTLAADAKEAKVKVRNPEGEIIRTFSLQQLKKGENKITWNGQNDQGAVTRPGEYEFIVEATDSAGKKLATKTDFEGIISGVNYTAEGPVLLVGNQTLRMSDVKKIIDPSLMRNDQNVKDVTAQDLKKDTAPAQNESIPSASNLTKNVGMSREMLNKFSKETATTNPPANSTEPSVKK